MEKYKVFFMMFSGIYLILFGYFMKKGRKSNLKKVIGIYTLAFGIYSILSSLFSISNNKLGGFLYNIFSVLLIMTFLLILILNLATKRSEK